jgi:hypothetical protein
LGETATVTARATEIFKRAPDCPKTPAVAVGGSDVTFTNIKCLAVRDEFANVGHYPVIVTSGASLQDLGDVRLREDNFVVRRLP